MERRTGEPRCGKPDGSGCTDAKFLLGRTAEKRKGCISQPEWAGRSLGSLSSAGWQRETSRNSLAGHRQRREILDFWPARGRGKNFRVTFPGEARRWRKEISRAETVPGVVDIYIYILYIHMLSNLLSSSLFRFSYFTYNSVIDHPCFFPHHLKSGARRSTGSSFFVLFPASHMTRGIDIVE